MKLSEKIRKEGYNPPYSVGETTKLIAEIVALEQAQSINEAISKHWKREADIWKKVCESMATTFIDDTLLIQEILAQRYEQAKKEMEKNE